MIIDKETVKYVANLSRIELKEKELDKLAVQLESILDFIDKLKELEVSSVNPTSHILALNNVFRKDTPKGSLPVDIALKNAPRKKDNFFCVPKIIE